jgi:hypothetical protein
LTDLLFTLFDYSNCFLLRHCCFSSFPFGIYRIERISCLVVPKLTAERWTPVKLAKKRPHPLTRKPPTKRATFPEKVFPNRREREFRP